MRLLRFLATTLMMLVLFLLTVEVAVRVAKPQPRRSLAHTSVIGPFSEVLGVPVYQNTGWTTTPSPRPAGCSDPEAFQVTVTGSSILHGVSLPYEAAPEAVLQAALERVSPGRAVCVQNLAVPGFKTLQVLALAEQAMIQAPPDVLVIEAWDSSHVPVRIGDLMVPVSGDPEDPWIGNPMHLPEPLHNALGSRSRAYAYVLAALPDRTNRPILEDWLLARLDRIAALAAQSQTRVILVLPLGFGPKPPLAVESDKKLEATWHETVRQRNMDFLTFRELFEGVDAASLYIDPVHLSGAGVQVVSDALVERVRPTMAAVTTPQPDDATAN